MALSCVSSGDPERISETTIESAVYGGAGPAGPLPWRLGSGSSVDVADAVASGRRVGQDPEDQDPETVEQRDARLRLEFGSNVLIAADGSVTKQFFLAGDLAETFLKLIAEIIERGDVDRIADPWIPGTRSRRQELFQLSGHQLADPIVGRKSLNI